MKVIKFKSLSTWSPTKFVSSLMLPSYTFHGHQSCVICISLIFIVGYSISTDACVSRQIWSEELRNVANLRASNLCSRLVQPWSSNSRQSASSHVLLIHPANVTHRLCGMFNVVKCLSLYIDVPLEFSVQETANYKWKGKSNPCDRWAKREDLVKMPRLVSRSAYFVNQKTPASLTHDGRIGLECWHRGQLK